MTDLSTSNVIYILKVSVAQKHVTCSELAYPYFQNLIISLFSPSTAAKKLKDQQWMYKRLSGKKTGGNISNKALRMSERIIHLLIIFFEEVENAIKELKEGRTAEPVQTTYN